MYDLQGTESGDSEPTSMGCGRLAEVVGMEMLYELYIYIGI